MRITEHALRKIIREELAAADYKAAAAAETQKPTAEIRSSLLGDRNMRRRDLEEEIKKAITEALGDIPDLGTQTFRWYASTTATPPDIDIEANQRVVIEVVPGRMWFVLEWPEFSLDPVTTDAIKRAFNKLWQVPEGDTISNNVLRLKSLKGDVYEITVDFPKQDTSSKISSARNLADAKYTKKSGDSLSKILLDFYGLPLSRSNYPIYRLFARKYTNPQQDNPDVIPDGAVITLPGTVKPAGRPEMTRKKDVE